MIGLHSSKCNPNSLQSLNFTSLMVLLDKAARLRLQPLKLQS